MSSSKQDLKVRDFTQDDIDLVNRLSVQHGNPFPNFSNMLGGLVVEDSHGKVLGFGFIEKFAEMVFVPDLELPNISISKILKVLNEEAKKCALKFNIHELYGCITNDSYARLLEKHFGYKVRPGELLYTRF